MPFSIFSFHKSPLRYTCGSLLYYVCDFSHNHQFLESGVGDNIVYNIVIILISLSLKSNAMEGVYMVLRHVINALLAKQAIVGPG